MKTISNNLLKSFKKAPLNNVVFILFLLASIFLTRTLLGFLGWRNDFTLVALLFVAIINTFFILFLSEENSGAKLCFALILLGSVLRLFSILIMRTEPVSDFNTSNFVYQMLRDYSGEHQYRSIGGYYARYPAWYPFMRVVLWIYNLLGFNIEYIKYFNIILNIITSLFLYFSASMLGTKKIALVTTALYFLSPSMILWVNIQSPDHIFNLLISLFMFLLAKQYNFFKREELKKSFVLYLILSAIVASSTNMFKPIAMYILIAYLCTEVMIYIRPHLFKFGDILSSIKVHYKKWLIFIVVFFVSYSAINSMVARSIEKMFDVEVVDTSGMFLMWGTTVDEYGNYSSKTGTEIINEIRNRYGGDWNNPEFLREVRDVAISNLVANLRLMPRIMYQKFEGHFLSAWGFWGWANTNSDADNVAALERVLRHPSIMLATAYFNTMFILTLVSFLRFYLFREDNRYGYWMPFFLALGYTLVLLIGGIQGRYTAILMPQISVCAAYGLSTVEDILRKSKETASIHINRRWKSFVKKD